MPIRPENKARYPADWPRLSREIRESVGWRCEWCAAPDWRIAPEGVWRFDNGYFERVDGGYRWHADDALTQVDDLEPEPTGRNVRIILTVAHLDHQPENCGRSNLRALCQQCHNRYDLPHRQKTKAGTRAAMTPEEREAADRATWEKRRKPQMVARCES